MTSGAAAGHLYRKDKNATNLEYNIRTGFLIQTETQSWRNTAEYVLKIIQ
jgi:hypothetical protein